MYIKDKKLKRSFWRTDVYDYNSRVQSNRHMRKSLNSTDDSSFIVKYLILIIHQSKPDIWWLDTVITAWCAGSTLYVDRCIPAFYRHASETA